MKTPVLNISAVAIIYRASNPAEVFLDRKDDTHPIKLVRGQLCPIGGNWIGEDARFDESPLATLKRELQEELSFRHVRRDTRELVLLDMADRQVLDPSVSATQSTTDQDERVLRELKAQMMSQVVPFGDFLDTTPKSVLDAADPTNTRDGFTTLSSKWLIALDEDLWRELSRLQKTYGNLSNECITVMTSLEEMIRTRVYTAFAHDRALQQFFRSHGLPLADDLSLIPGLSSVQIGSPLPSYADYFLRYDIAKKPI